MEQHTSRARRSGATASLLVIALTASLFAAPTVAAADHDLVTLQGMVFNGKSTEPVKGASIHVVTYEGRESRHSAEAVSDADGAFKIALGPGKAELHIEAKGFDALSTAFEVPTENFSASYRLAPVPDRDASVTGRVLDAAGNPVAGARVTMNLQGHHHELTAADGDAAMTKEGPDGAQTSESRIARPEPAPSRYDWQETRTDANGAFAFKTFPGRAYFNVEAPGHAYANRDMDLQAGTNDAGEFRLLKVPDRDAKLTGRVIDASTGLPIAGAQVNVQNLAWNRYNWTQTDKEGRFTVWTLPGHARIDVYAGNGNAYAEVMDTEADAGEATAGGDEVGLAVEPLIAPVPGPRGSTARYYSYATVQQLESGNNAFEARLTPRAQPSLILQGYVVDGAAGRGVPGASLSVRNEDTGEWGHVKADKDGSYRMRVNPGHLVLEAWADGYFSGVAMHNAEQGGVARVDVNMVKGETRYAPCDDCYIAYAQDDAVAQEGKIMAADGGAPPPAAPPSSPSRASLSGTDPDGAAAYNGEAGGLGPYTPPSPQQSDGEARVRATPAAPVVMLVALVAAAAIAARGRLEKG